MSYIVAKIKVSESKEKDIPIARESKDTRLRRLAFKKLTVGLLAKADDNSGLYLIKSDQVTNPEFEFRYLLSRAEFSKNIEVDLSRIKDGIIYTNRPYKLIGESHSVRKLLSKLFNKKITIKKKDFHDMERN